MAFFRRRFQQKRRDKQADEGWQLSSDPGLRWSVTARRGDEPEAQALSSENEGWRLLDTHVIPSKPGNERLAMASVVEAAQALHLPARRLDELGTAVAEATMNAMEHGNQYRAEIPVTLQILSSDRAISVRISDQGGDGLWSTRENYEAPDLAAKLAEHQSPRGWGLFLIQQMVDEMHVSRDGKTHTVELIMRLEGDIQAQQKI